jgi:hypothetical protein
MGLDNILYYYCNSLSSLYFAHCLAQLRPRRNSLSAWHSSLGVSQDDRGLSKCEEAALTETFALLCECEPLALNEERPGRGGGFGAEEGYQPVILPCA